MEQFYLVIAGLRSFNFTNDPVKSDQEACISAFGFYDATFKCIPVGKTKPKMSARQYIVKNGVELLNT